MSRHIQKKGWGQRVGSSKGGVRSIMFDFCLFFTFLKRLDEPEGFRVLNYKILEFLKREIWGGQIFILDFAIFHQDFLLTSGFFSETEEASTPPPCGLLIEVYIFHEN
jgi:hypothetical protein